MTKSVSVSIGLMLLWASAWPAEAQTSPTAVAVEEAVRRQADTLALRQKLDEARRAESRKDLVAAAKLYEEAYKLVESIGDFTTPEARATISSLSALKLDMARAAQKRGDLEEAAVHVNRVLKINPRDEAALAFKKHNDRLIEEQKGRRPTGAAIERAKAAQQERIEANTLVQDARVLLEAGKLDEAEAKLKQAVNLDPENRAAYYYLSLLKEKRFAEADRRRNQDSRQSIVEVQQEWAKPVKRESLPVPNPYATTNLVHTGKGRQAILSKLDRIRLETVGPWDNLPLSEVIRILSEEARKRDPEKKGINFIINPHAEAPSQPVLGAQVIDPTTGLPVTTFPTAPEETVDVGSINIRIDPPLTDLRLADVLDAIVKVAEKPIKYSIEDYAIMFSQRGPETAQLYTRTFKVDPNTFIQGLENVGALEFGGYDASTTGGGRGGGFGGGGGRGGGRGGGGGFGGGGGGQFGLGAIIARVTPAGGAVGGGGQGAGQISGGGEGGIRFITRTNTIEEVQAAARNFFTTVGVDLTPPKALFFNDRAGVLLVRATLQDLDMIEAAMQVLCTVPPQVNIKSKFVEITQDDNRGLGFDWYLGNFLMNNRAIGAQGGTAPSFGAPPSPANPQGVFPGSLFGGTTIAPAQTDQLITGGLRNPQTALFTLTGILTDPQFRVVIRALEQRGGVDVLSSTEITVISGRQAQMKATDVKTVIIDYDFSQAIGGTAPTTGGSGGTGGTGGAGGR
jgi:general secretion pathway protein D